MQTTSHATIWRRRLTVLHVLTTTALCLLLAIPALCSSIVDCESFLTGSSPSFPLLMLLRCTFHVYFCLIWFCFLTSCSVLASCCQCDPLSNIPLFSSRHCLFGNSRECHSVCHCSWMRFSIIHFFELSYWDFFLCCCRFQKLISSVRWWMMHVS